MKLVFAGSILLLFAIFLASCTRDQISEPDPECPDDFTYEADIRFIVDNACSYAGCHNGTAPGRFTNYQEIQNYTSSGDQFRRRVVVDRDMPPSYADIGPTELTEEEIQMINCWAEAGYPEN